MAQDVLGYTTLQVIPVLQGATGQLEGQLSGPMTAAGRSAGQAAGQAVASGLEQARGAVEAASAKLAAARDKEADAAGKVRVAEAKLQELRDKGNASASQLARAEEALAAAQRNGDRASRARQNAVQNLSDARARLANTTDDAAEAESRFSRAMSSISDRIGPAATQMASLAAATAGVGGAMATVSEAMSREKSTDVLAAQLGATPALAQEYGATAATLYKNAFGESFGDVTSAVGAVSSAFATLGSEGEASLELVTGRALNFAEAFGTEVPESVQTASQLITNGLAKDSTEAFDLLTASFQRMPVAMRDELPEIINEYGTHFHNLGFSGQQAFSLLVDYSKQGKFALDKAGDALKEFTLLGSDMSTSSQEAYKTIGLDAQAMSDAIASGGPAAQDALQKVASGLLTITEPAALANTAIALFGTPIEDLSIDKIPAFLQALTGGSQSMAGFAGSTDQMGTTLSDNATTKLEMFKRAVQDGLVNVLGAAVGWIDKNRTAAMVFAGILGTLGVALVTAKVAAMGYAVAQGVMAAASGAGTAALAGNTLALGAYTIATGVIKGATMAWSAVQWVLNAALSANPIGLVVVAIGALIAGIVLAYKNSETFRNIVQAAWEGIKNAALWAWDNVLKPTFAFLSAAFQDAGAAAMWLWHNGIKPAFDGISAVISFWWDNVVMRVFGAYKLAFEAAAATAMWLWNNGIKPAFDGMGAVFDWFNTKVTEVKDWVVGKFTDVVGFVAGLPGKVKDAASGLWDGIKDSFRGAINWLISAWNNFQLGFDFTIPVINKHIQFTIDTPNLPMLAGGGVAGRTKDGRLWGPGTPTSDSILGVGADGIPTALVSTKEGVVNAWSMDHGGAELVAALNAGWVPPLDMLRAMLPSLAGGGLVAAKDWARGKAGNPYQYGGVGNPSWDCSGIASDLYAVATGKATGTRYFTTESDFTALGFVSGLGGPNDMSIGVMRGGGGPDSHMATTLGDLNVESSGTDGVEVGSGAQGAADFPLKWHLPLGGDPGGMLNPGNGGTSGLGSGGTGGGSGGGSGGSSSSDGSGGSSTRPAGTAVPVWVDNWPTNLGAATAAQSSSSTPSSSPSDSFTPGGDAGEPFDQAAAVNAALAKGGAAFGKAGEGALRGNLDGIPGASSVVSGFEKQAGNIQIVVADVFEAVGRFQREQQRQAMSAGSRF